MGFSRDDTIVAVATPIGRGGLGVVRISGPAAPEVTARLLARGRPLEPRHATLTRVIDAGGARSTPSTASDELSAAGRGDRWTPLDQVIATFFPGPGSYTGEDTVELSAHGSPVVLERILSAAQRAGARLAQPGEFTLRAYLNGKLDLIQAEAVADLIDAVTPTQARQAFDQLTGGLTQSITAIGDRLFNLIVKLEASLDFPEEGYHFAQAKETERELAEALAAVRALLDGSRRGRMIREGRHVVLAGGTNVGKSSLFNALVGVERAIVTPVAGTTRDMVTEACDIEGALVTLVDTAGLRSGAGLVEQEGIRRARDAASVAALVVVVLDGSRPLAESEEGVRATQGMTRILVVNKSDLPAAWDRSMLGEEPLKVSARTGSGLTTLRGAIVRELSGGEERLDGPRMSNVRHIRLLEVAHECLLRGLDQARLRAPEELVVADLQEARAALDDVLGRRTSEDVLTAIFSEFCVGK